MNKMAVKFSVLLLSMSVLFRGESQGTTIDIKKSGAVADGKTDISVVLLKVWKQACAAASPTTILIPTGQYALNEVSLQGPCKSPIGLTIDGTLIAKGDLKHFKAQAWITLLHVKKVTVSGKGVLDGNGESAWMKNECHKNPMCKNLPMNLRLDFVEDSTVKGITSKDSKNFHINLLGSKNIVIDHIKIIAPGNSANTDGIHMGRSAGVNITNAVIKTGDDCVSVGDEMSKVLVQNVTCGPGHGISIGSLGKYANEKPVTGIVVRKCKISGTTNGVRIKSWPSSPSPNSASDMHFEDITMENVANPILIDQEYCPHNQCNKKTPSSVKISNVSFRRIKGTSSTAVAVTLICSSTHPCTNVQISDIDLKYSGSGGPAKSVCKNIRPTLSGKLSPQICAAAPKGDVSQILPLSR